jgi:hypothetical protein
VTRAEARDDDADVLAVAQKGRRADEAVEVLCVADVARVHHDEPRREPVPFRPRVVAALWRDRTRVHPVRDHPQTLGGRALRLEPLAHGLADRDDAVGAAQVRADEPAQHADDRRVAEPVELGGDLGEDVLADDEHGSAEAASHGHAEVSHDRRVGHAEDEIGRRARERVPERVAEVREVVRCPPGELGALVRGRCHPHDADAVVLRLPRLALGPVKDSVATSTSWSSAGLANR